MNLILSISLDANPWIAASMFAAIFVLLLVLFFFYKKLLFNKAQKAETYGEDAGAEESDVCISASQGAPTAIAPGRSGELKLVRVCERDAALLMAIVAEEMQVPLNQIIFKSITCCEEKDNEV